MLATEGLTWDAGLKVVGIDPGGTAGLVCLQVGARLIGEPVKVLGSVTVAHPGWKGATWPERDAQYGETMAKQLVEWAPDLVVLEEPADARIAWRGIAKQRQDTAFRLGAYYGAAVCAARRACPHLQSYPVTSYRGQAGWMSGFRGAGKESIRDAVMARVSYVLRAGGADTRDWAEHQLMAAGVALYHLESITAARMAAKIRAAAGREDEQPRRRVRE